MGQRSHQSGYAGRGTSALLVLLDRISYITDKQRLSRAQPTFTPARKPPKCPVKPTTATPAASTIHTYPDTPAPRRRPRKCSHHTVHTNTLEAQPKTQCSRAIP